MLSTESLLLAVFVLSVVVAVGRRIHRAVSPSPPPLPPGPPPLPFLGNIHQLPKSHTHETFAEWSKTYGEIMSVTLLGKPIIILSSRRTVMDVMEKSAAASAGRPYLIMGHELVGFGKLPTMTNDMTRHKKYRRLFAKALSSSACQKYWSSQVREMRRTVVELLETESEIVPPIKRGVGSIISDVVYGHTVQSPDDDFLARARQVVVIFERLVRPGAYLVDIFPILRYVPAWFPGAQFQRDAAKWKAFADDLRAEHLDQVKASMLRGTQRPCYVTNVLEGPDGLPRADNAEEEDLVRYSAGTLYGAGADTTAAAIQNFLVAMLRFPAVQARAQAELDAVIGRDRLPSIEDRERLPYCAAMVQEILRWKPIVPMCIPHAMVQDEVYDGYLLPKGATVLPNIWALTRDPALYPNPEEFRPERFLSADGSRTVDGGREGFGFGRRVCAGIHLAEASIFAFVTTLLWTASVTGKPGWDGLEIEYEPGAVNRPKEIPCSIRPRSAQALELLKSALVE